MRIGDRLEYGAKPADHEPGPKRNGGCHFAVHECLCGNNEAGRDEGKTITEEFVVDSKEWKIQGLFELRQYRGRIGLKKSL